MEMPKVTVLLPVYNVVPYLVEAIDSLLRQTHGDFEVLAIDDGSTDGSLEVLETINDSRFTLHRNEANRGLVYTLNKGLDLASGDYIVRLDADDIALPQRIARHLQFMERHPDVGISGCYTRQFGDVNCDLRHSLEHEAIVAEMLFNNALSGCSPMFRRSALRELRFSEDAPHAEDYELFARTSAHITLANVPEVLILRRNHQDQVSSRFSEIQRRSSNEVRCALLARFGIFPTEAERALHSQISTYEWQKCPSFLARSNTWLLKIAEEVNTRDYTMREAVRTRCLDKLREIIENLD